MGTYGVTETTGTELSQLIASEVHIQREITLKASAGALVRGTVLEMVSVASGQWQTLATVADARAILLEDAANLAATQKVQAYFVGKYKYEDLTWPAGITTLDKRTAIVALQDRGIIMDEAILAMATTTTTTTTTTSSTSSTTS